MSDHRSPVLPSVPSGTVTFLLTDIVGSTALGHRAGAEAFAAILKQHHSLLRHEFERAGGFEFKETGDGFWVAFSDLQAALRCGRTCQERLRTLHDPVSGKPVLVRMAISVASIQPENGEYHGLALYDASRLLGAARGGQILVSESAEVLLRHSLPEDMILRNRGRFRLRDLPTPETLFDVVWPGMLVPDSPSPAATPVYTPVLPSLFTRFIGREEEIAEIVLRLQDSRYLLITLTGMGGSGKSRLALEAARRASDCFYGAVWFVPLASIDKAEYVPETIRRVIGAERHGDVWEALRAVFSAAQPCLLVLDNLEQLLTDASDPGDGTGLRDFICRFFERFPQVTLLTTSRHRLGLSMEWEYPVHPLPIPPREMGGVLPENLRDYSSVALFLDCASRARPGFTLTDQNAEAIQELCVRLEGMPLAVELAGAWARLLTPREMLSEFKTIQQSRDHDRPERHRSLAAATDGSYRLLSPDLRRFFCQLSVFQGGWTVVAARVVCNAPDALLLLSELRDRSLVLVEEKEGSSRYRFLETLREFAEERFIAEDPGEAKETHKRYQNFFASLVVEAEPKLKGAEQADWLNRLAAEQENLRTVLAHSSLESRLTIASQLHRYWMVRGHIAEGRAWLKGAIRSASDTVIASPVKIKALNIAGALALSAGDLSDAHSLFTECRNLSQQCDDKENQARSLINLAIVAGQRGNLTEARREYEQSLPVWRHLNRLDTLAVILSNLGAVAIEQADYEAARDYLEESLLMQNERSDTLLRANTLQNLAEIAAQQKDHVRALKHLETCLNVRLALEDRSAFALLAYSVAEIKHDTGQWEEAVSLYRVTRIAIQIAQTALPPGIQAQMEDRLKDVRQKLGESVFLSLWESERTLTWNQVIDRICQAVKK
jgi:predicted ATPase/class 3 adenylate cyclase/Flp pilus assembly protein TadD